MRLLVTFQIQEAANPELDQGRRDQVKVVANTKAIARQGEPEGLASEGQPKSGAGSRRSCEFLRLLFEQFRRIIRFMNHEMGAIHLVQRGIVEPVTVQAELPIQTRLRLLDRAVRFVCVCGSVLVILLAFLLFAQWPLRDLVQSYSREANDLAQCLFALYAGIAITYATRMRSHLAADALTQRYSPRVRACLERVAALTILLPWSTFMLYSMGPLVWQSVRQLERFPETYNPGYFVLKMALALCALLVLLQGLLVITRREAQ